MLDAAKTVPFQDQALKSLALDDDLRASLQHAGGAVAHDAETLTQSYLQRSGVLLRLARQDGSPLGFGRSIG